MSRKRACSQATGLSIPEEEYECEYYRPGCYCTPQVVRQSSPYTCAYLLEYPPQWNVSSSPATYVVDACGMVYYSSDFEHQFQLNNNMALETEITTYHYCDKHECASLNNEESDDEAVSPRKKERFEEGDIEVEENEAGGAAEYDMKTAEAIRLGTAYRSEHGYLVEEPVETVASVPKKV